MYVHVWPLQVYVYGDILKLEVQYYWVKEDSSTLDIDELLVLSPCFHCTMDLLYLYIEAITAWTSSNGGCHISHINGRLVAIEYNKTT